MKRSLLLALAVACGFPTVVVLASAVAGEWTLALVFLALTVLCGALTVTEVRQHARQQH